MSPGGKSRPFALRAANLDGTASFRGERGTAASAVESSAAHGTDDDDEANEHDDMARGCIGGGGGSLSGTTASGSAAPCAAPLALQLLPTSVAEAGAFAEGAASVGAAIGEMKRVGAASLLALSVGTRV